MAPSTPQSDRRIYSQHESPTEPSMRCGGPGKRGRPVLWAGLRRSFDRVTTSERKEFSKRGLAFTMLVAICNEILQDVSVEGGYTVVMKPLMSTKGDSGRFASVTTRRDLLCTTKQKESLQHARVQLRLFPGLCCCACLRHFGMDLTTARSFAMRAPAKKP
jgi:hypothetical protein